MTALVLIGLFGLVLLLVSVAFGDLAHDGLLGLLGVADLARLGAGPVTLPCVAAFLAALGLGSSALARFGGLPLPVAVLAGLVLAVAVLGLSLWGTATLIGAEPRPPRTADVLGAFGTVVTRIPATGLGQVAVRTHGQRVTFSARSSRPVPAGTEVYVLEVVSPTCLVVEALGL